MCGRSRPTVTNPLLAVYMSMEAMNPSSPRPEWPVADLMPFVVDLTAHEVRRVGALLDAIPDWDPATVLAAETEAYALLYCGLNAEQRAIYDLLHDKGVRDAGP
jgi:hypothetical protein